MNTRADRKAFHDVARKIYRDDPEWVCPLESDIESIFDPNENPNFSNGEAVRWILLDDHGNYLGRVAAFVNYDKTKYHDCPTGGMGFFESVNDRQAAFTLFEKCETWLRERSMKAMTGSVNFGENQEYWGVLVEGFTRPSYGTNYNPPYYEELFRAYSFEPQFKQYTNLLDLRSPLPERFSKVAERLFQKPEFEFFSFKGQKEERFIQDMITVYHKAWKDQRNYSPLRYEYVKHAFEKLKPIIDEDLICFAYAHGEPVGFMVAIPDINQILRGMNGKLNGWKKLKMGWDLWRRRIRKAKVTIMGVVPEYQEKGVEAGMIMSAYHRIVPRKQYEEVELSWVGDFNEKMRSLHTATGARHEKTHTTFVKTIQ